MFSWKYVQVHVQQKNTNRFRKRKTIFIAHIFFFNAQTVLVSIILLRCWGNFVDKTAMLHQYGYLCIPFRTIESVAKCESVDFSHLVLRQL